jgi:hypothetical protein
LGAFFGENLRKPLDRFGDQAVRLFDSAARLVDESDLDVRPAITKSLRITLWEKGRSLIIRDSRRTGGALFGASPGIGA